MVVGVAAVVVNGPNVDEFNVVADKIVDDGKIVAVVTAANVGVAEIGGKIVSGVLVGRELALVATVVLEAGMVKLVEVDMFNIPEGIEVDMIDVAGLVERVVASEEFKEVGVMKLEEVASFVTNVVVGLLECVIVVDNDKLAVMGVWVVIVGMLVEELLEVVDPVFELVVRIGIVVVILVVRAEEELPNVILAVVVGEGVERVTELVVYMVIFVVVIFLEGKADVGVVEGLEGAIVAFVVLAALVLAMVPIVVVLMVTEVDGIVEAFVAAVWKIVKAEFEVVVVVMG